MDITEKLRRIKQKMDAEKRKAANQGMCSTCEETLVECWCDSMAEFAASE